MSDLTVLPSDVNVRRAADRAVRRRHLALEVV